MARILYHHRIRADDGQAVHVRELIGALRRRGHEVRECALFPKAGEPGGAGPAKRSIWQGIGVPRIAREVVEILYNRRALPRLVRAAREMRAEFLYERHALHCRAGLAAAREVGIPFILEVNSPHVAEMTELGLLRFPGRARATEREVLSQADRVLPVTAELAALLREAGAPEERMRVIGNGAQPERYGPQERQQARELRRELGISAGMVLGFSGFMRPWHGLEMALEALAAPALESLHLLLVGHGPALGGIMERARHTGLGGRVHSVGAVAPAELPRYICAFDAALIAAINPYASPLKLYEALAAGVVTVAPRQDNLSAVIADGKTGLLFDAGSATSLAVCLQKLVADPDRAGEIGAAGRQSLVDRDWTWDGAARRVLDAYRELLR